MWTCHIMNGSELSEWWKSAQLKTVLNSHSCYRRIFSATLVLPMRHGVRGVMTSILYRFMQSRGYSKKVQLRQKSCVYTPPPPLPLRNKILAMLLDVVLYLGYVWVCWSHEKSCSCLIIAFHISAIWNTMLCLVCYGWTRNEWRGALRRNLGQDYG